MIFQTNWTITTSGRSLIDITSQITEQVVRANIETGLCHLFLHHTSASLIIGENADPLVLEDLESFMLRLTPDGDPLFKHIAEGPDDMPSHIRSVLTQSCLTLPISDQRLALGTWQGVFLWEHRLRGHQRKITLTALGNH